VNWIHISHNRDQWQASVNHHHHHHHHHHHISFMELGHLLTGSGLTYPKVFSKVYHNSFCQLGSSISLLWVIYFEAFYLHAGPEAKGSNSATGFTLFWARNPFRGNFNHWQVSWKEASVNKVMKLRVPKIGRIF